jgi:hypothetical protein
MIWLGYSCEQLKKTDFILQRPTFGFSGSGGAGGGRKPIRAIAGEAR